MKLNSDESIERHKAMLVVKGYKQIEGFDYQDTFSLVAKLTIVKIFLALTTIHKWHLSKMDVHNAFFNGNLNEKIYIDLTPSYQIKGKHHGRNERLICRLHKSFYGLK